jgi:hypothetical protein
MAKIDYLEYINRVLDRINQDRIADVTAVSGDSQIVANYINEAQDAINQEDTWYSLQKTRTFSSVVYTASTISFADTNPDTILDSANGLGNFQAGQTFTVGGSASNNGVYVIDTVTAGALTLQTTDSLTVEAAGSPISLIAITYPVAADFGTSYDMVDMTNNRPLAESFANLFNISDPDFDRTGTPSYFSVEGDFYRFYEIPAGIYKFRETYYKIPDTLTANTDTSDLPIETQLAIIEYAYARIQEYNRAIEVADRATSKFNKFLASAMKKNKAIMRRRQKVGTGSGPLDNNLNPRLGGHYPRGY